MDKQKSRPTHQPQQQQSQELHLVQQYLQQTEPGLDARLEQVREEENYEHFALAPNTVRFASTTDATQMPPQTVNPAQLLQQPTQRRQVEQAQMEGIALTQNGQNLQGQQTQRFPFFAIPAIAHEVIYPHPQQQPPSLSQRYSFEQPQQRAQSNGALRQQLQQNGQPRSFQQLQHPPQPYQTFKTQQHQPFQNLQQGGEAWMHQRQNPHVPRPLSPGSQAKLSRSYVGIDLDSKSQTEVPEFHFPIEGFPNPRTLKSKPAAHDGSGSKGVQTGQGASIAGMYKRPFPGPITFLHVPNVVAFCILVKNFLRQVFGNEDFGAEGILRLETLDLWKLEGPTEGYVVLADDACRISFPEQVKTEVWKPTYYTAEGQKMEEGVNMYRRKWLNASVFAVLVPKKGTGLGAGSGNTLAWEKDVRFFWSVFPVWPMLQLAGKKGLAVVKDFAPGSMKHKQLSTWLRESFLDAVIPPDSQDFKNAMLETDYCPSMIDPDNAVQRLHQNPFLYFASKDALGYGSDLSDDRYFHHLHPAEREAASLAELTCAQYLFIKRQYFSAFYEDIYRSDKKIDPDASNTVSGRGVATQSQRPARRLSRRTDESPDREDTPMSVTGIPTATPPAATRAPPASAQSRASGTTARRLRVRTETAHKNWLVNTHDMRSHRAKCLVTCWKEFGFLEEGRYLDWVRAGGMFEDAEVEDPDRNDDED